MGRPGRGGERAVCALDAEEEAWSVGPLHEANDAIGIEHERGEAAYSEGGDHRASRVDDETLVHTVALGPRATVWTLSLIHISEPTRPY